MKTSSKKVLYLALVAIIFALGFYRNQWRTVDMTDVQYRRDVSEIYVLGRLVKSQQDGVFSAGGLMGIGDVTESSVESRVINNQYEKYNSGKGFSQYWIYKSHPGLQGILFSAFDALTDFTPMRNLSIFRLATSLLSAMTLALFCLWVAEEIGWIASLFVVFFILTSTWLTILGGNIYWSLWSFYLPLTVFPIFIKKAEHNPDFHYSGIMFIAFILALLKILFSGFEFITSSLLMFAVPFVYYAVLNRWGWKLLFRRMVQLGISLLLSVITGLAILAFQIRSVSGSYREVLQYIIFSWSKRTYGYEELLGNATAPQENFFVKILEVIDTYLKGYAFSLSRYIHGESTWIRDIMDGRYLYLILLFVLATILFFIMHPPSRKTMIFEKGNALAITSWFSILGPLSWFVIFRDHAALHTRLDFIVWQMPFALYGFAMVGFVFTNLRNPWHSDKARP